MSRQHPEQSDLVMRPGEWQTNPVTGRQIVGVPRWLMITGGCAPPPNILPVGAVSLAAAQQRPDGLLTLSDGTTAKPEELEWNDAEYLARLARETE